MWSTTIFKVEVIHNLDYEYDCRLRQSDRLAVAGKIRRWRGSGSPLLLAKLPLGKEEFRKQPAALGTEYALGHADGVIQTPVF